MRSFLIWVAYRSKPHLVFITLSILFGGAMVFLNPPLRAPDEPGHFVRAYQAANAQIESPSTNGNFPIGMRTDIGNDFNKWLDSRAKTFGHPRPQRDNVSAIIDGLTPKLLPGSIPVVVGPSQAMVFSGAYFPQAIAIKIGLLLHASFLELMYAARVAALLFSVIVTAFAIRIMPFGHWCLVAPNLLPMAVYERACLSTDGLTMAGASLVIASILRLDRE